MALKDREAGIRAARNNRKYKPPYPNYLKTLEKAEQQYQACRDYDEGFREALSSKSEQEITSEAIRGFQLSLPILERLPTHAERSRQKILKSDQRRPWTPWEY